MPMKIVKGNYEMSTSVTHSSSVQFIVDTLNEWRMRIPLEAARARSALCL